jgi:hypothetical protein
VAAKEMLTANKAKKLSKVRKLKTQDDCDQRTIQYRLQKQFAASGELGKPGRPRKKASKN